MSTSSKFAFLLQLPLSQRAWSYGQGTAQASFPPTVPKEDKVERNGEIRYVPDRQTYGTSQRC